MTDIPTPINSSDDYSTPMEALQQYTPNNLSEGNKVTYKTPFNRILCFLVYVFLIVGIFASSFNTIDGIITGELPRALGGGIIPLFFPIVAIVLGSIYSLYFIITIDKELGIITIYSKKIFCCCNKKRIIEFNIIEQISIKSITSTNSQKGENSNDTFEVIFKLYNGRNIKGFSGSDTNYEGNRIFTIFRDSLPQNIPINRINYL